MKNKGKRNALIRRISSHASLCHALCACLGVYILIQIIAAIGYLPGDKVFTRLVRYTKHVPAPYIAFLASALTPRAKDMNRPCLWNLYRDRRVMSRLEWLLEDSRRYFEVREFIIENFDRCIIKNMTSVNAGDANYSVKTSTKTPQKSCFVQPKDMLYGPKIMVNSTPPSLEEIGLEYPELKLGGHYPGPKHCKRPRHSTAIIIPYRNRDMHLRFWLHYTIGMLIKQQLRFTVFVVEQEGKGVFNKGQLMNTAFQWALKNDTTKWDCYIFHDVDMLPEIVGNLYMCSDEKTVTHLAPYVDKFNYTTRPKVGITVGGAVAFTAWQYKAVNGYSNIFWGWGGEDDDMNLRIRLTGLKRWRPSKEYGRYKMVRHQRDNGNPVNLIRHKLLKSARARMAVDGLANLRTHISQVVMYRTHTRILVRVNTKTNPPPNYKIDTPEVAEMNAKENKESSEVEEEAVNIGMK